MIAVRDADGNLVDGAVTIAAGEQRWLFAPTTDWKAGSYTIIVDGMLEDRAGNSIGRPFEVDAFRPIERAIPSRQVSRPIKIAG